MPEVRSVRKALFFYPKNSKANSKKSPKRRFKPKFGLPPPKEEEKKNKKKTWRCH
ncbi:hypothetical protein B7P43_G15146 [Cryptotermes secundus]|uniref:Uncharacterized protein n=1 Tax=Cryptotermes secundus TaxID=105785 RepID=A0A2J7RS79_9NEOP|nr:hypothetical protein B7P43_G15146 [Cryptotermes secundus]